MIFHGRLSDRNYVCRQRPRYLIFSQFSIRPILLPKCVCLRGSASDPTGGLLAPPAGKRWVSPLQRAPQNCGPHGPENPQSATDHGDTICHPRSGYVGLTTKLHGTSTCRCNNNAIFSDRAMFTFPTVAVCQPR